MKDTPEMKELELTQVISACIERLAEDGLRIRELECGPEVENLVSGVGKPYLTPVMSPRSNDFTKKNAFWLVCEDSSGPKMIGGARLDDLGDEDLTKFWQRSLARQYGAEANNFVEATSELISRDVSGRIAYFGDLYVVQGSAISRRSRERLRWFTAIGHALTLLKWQPNWTYAFLREEDILRGAAASYGFARVVPAPQHWIDPPSPRSNTEWCALSSRKEVVGMIKAAKANATRAIVQR